MKTSKFILCFLALAFAFSKIDVALSQAPALGVQLYAGVNITGTTGRLFSVQATSNLADSNSWACVGLVQLATTNYLWTDTSKSAGSGQRFYRTVSAATNLVYILPGTFTMGSPTNEALRGTDETQHVVTISKGFYMGKFLMTQAEYLATTGVNPSFHIGNLNYPVENMTWYDATNYCWLRTQQERAAGLIPTNWVYRLPTESEWEYACRAGTVTAFYLGSGLHSQQEDFAGTNEYDAAVGNIYNPTGVNLQETTVVGSYAPNGWGLYDMGGNVTEWCLDWYGQYPSAAVTDPQGATTGTNKARRGGRYLDSAVSCRSACRDGNINPIRTGGASGFRVVLAVQ